MSIPAKWAGRAHEVFARIGQLTVQRRVLHNQLNQIERQLDEAVKAAESLNATADLAAQVEADARPKDQPEPPPERTP